MLFKTRFSHRQNGGLLSHPFCHLRHSCVLWFVFGLGRGACFVFCLVLAIAFCSHVLFFVSHVFLCLFLPFEFVLFFGLFPIFVVPVVSFSFVFRFACRFVLKRTGARCFRFFTF